MSNSQTEEQILEIENQYWTEQKDALERLERNKDFQKLILDGYFKEFAANQTSMLAMDYTRQMNNRGEIFERLVAISNLQDYFITIKNMVAPAENYSEDE
jgi:hypothetical protein